MPGGRAQTRVVKEGAVVTGSVNHWDGILLSLEFEENTVAVDNAAQLMQWPLAATLDRLSTFWLSTMVVFKGPRWTPDDPWAGVALKVEGTARSGWLARRMGKTVGELPRPVAGLFVGGPPGVPADCYPSEQAVLDELGNSLALTKSMKTGLMPGDNYRFTMPNGVARTWVKNRGADHMSGHDDVQVQLRPEPGVLLRMTFAENSYGIRNPVVLSRGSTEVSRWFPPSAARMADKVVDYWLDWFELRQTPGGIEVFSSGVCDAGPLGQSPIDEQSGGMVPERYAAIMAASPSPPTPTREPRRWRRIFSCPPCGRDVFYDAIDPAYMTSPQGAAGNPTLMSTK
jgi:hypothetical protein